MYIYIYIYILALDYTYLVVADLLASQCVFEASNDSPQWIFKRRRVTQHIIRNNDDRSHLHELSLCSVSDKPCVRSTTTLCEMVKCIHLIGAELASALVPRRHRKKSPSRRARRLLRLVYGYRFGGTEIPTTGRRHLRNRLVSRCRSALLR